MTSGGSLILFCFLFAVLCLLCLIVLLTAVIILCRHLFCPHRDSAACRKGPLAMAMASLSKTFSESRTRIIGWSVARSVLADDISQTLVKILPDRKLWKCLQRSKTWSALIFDDQLFFPSSCPFVQCFSWTFCNPSYEQRFQSSILFEWWFPVRNWLKVTGNKWQLKF